jgi:hypothetical protein
MIFETQPLTPRQRKVLGDWLLCHGATSFVSERGTIISQLPVPLSESEGSPAKDPEC